MLADNFSGPSPQLELVKTLDLVLSQIPDLLTCDVFMRLGQRLTVLGMPIPSPMDVIGHNIEPIDVLNHIYYIETTQIPLR